MKFTNILKKYEETPIFRISQLKSDWADMGLQPESLGVAISRALKEMRILQLKRGFYVTQEYINSHNTENYRLYLANLLQKGSYISLQTALEYYEISTEYKSTITSISPKGTFNYKNSIGEYRYKSIKRDKFFGFKLEQIGEYNILIAEKYKAILDYLYFNVSVNAFRNYPLEDLLNEFRIDHEDLDNEELFKLRQATEGFTNEK